MKIDKLITAVFLLVANLVMLGHAVIPHHHHDTARFCFEDDRCPGSDRDGQDTGDDRCTARSFFLARSVQGDDDRQETGVCPGCGSHHFAGDGHGAEGATAFCLPVHTFAGLLFPEEEAGVPPVLFYRGLSPQDAFLSSRGLRAPPSLPSVS